jgi:hypothetical protein
MFYFLGSLKALFLWFLENTDTIKKNTEALLYASEEVGLEVNPEKIKRMLMSRSQKADQMQENEVGRACGTRGRGEKRVQGFGGKARRKKTT